MPTFQILVVSSTNLKKKLAKTTVLVENNSKENKDSYSSFSSGWLRSHSSQDIYFLVTQFSIFLSLSLFLPSQIFLIPFPGGSSFLYMAVGIAFKPSTWMVVDSSLDTCPNTTLLVVVEQDAKRGGIVQGSFCH